MKLSKTKQAKRKLIMDTTLNLVLKQGLANTTVKQIAQVASIDRKTFYNYFSDINDVMNHIIKEHSNNSWDEPVFKDDQLNGLEKLEAYMSKLFDQVLCDKPLMIMSLQNDYFHNNFQVFMGSRTLDELKHSQLYEIIQSGIDDGSINSNGMTTHALMVTIFVPLFSGMQKYYYREPFFTETFFTSLEDMKNYIIFIINGLKA